MEENKKGEKSVEKRTTDLPDEYAHSEYTSTLRGTNAKAKANAAQGLGEMLEIAFNGEVTPNKK